MVKFSSDSVSILRWKQEALRGLNAKAVSDPGLLAVKEGRLEDLKKLIKHENWDPKKVVDRNGCNALHWAAGSGYVGICIYLCEECGVEIDDLRGKKGMRRHALHWAARNGHISVLEWMILVKGVNVNVQTTDGTASIHFAAYSGQIETCKWLINVARCDVNIKNSFGCNASQWCAINGNIPLMVYFKQCGLDFLILNSNGHSAVHKAAIKGNIDACRWLLDPMGGGLSHGKHCLPDKEGWTPHRLALDNGHIELATFLLRIKDEYTC